MNNLIKLWELPGGIHPPENKQQSMQLPIAKIAIPAQLFIPLNQHIGAQAKPVVQVGDSVFAGQLIAAADGTFSANIHASSSGIVSAITQHALPHPSGMSGDVIVIDTDGKHQWIALEQCENYLTLDRLQLLEKIRNAGVAGLGGAGFPTAVKLNTKSTQIIDTLIINGAECEPYITADDALMQERANEIIAGTFLLSYILHHPKRLVIGVEDNKPKAIAALKLAVKNYTNATHAKDATIEVVTIPTKYPSGGAKQLIYILTGREVQNGHHSADIGSICVNVATAAAAWRAVRFGEPLISRIATITGDALTTQQNVDALLGTPIDFVLTQHGFTANKAQRVVMGGPMMGFTLLNLNAPVVKTTNCILAASNKELPPPPPAQACIRCGLCAEACPVNLLPQQLFWYAQAEDIERLQTHNIFDCIECGACSYVCPSKIPLVQYYRAGKGAIRLHKIEKEKADRSRQRFEFRKERIAKEDAEKEAKRAARKKAADEAKILLAERNAAKSSTDNNLESIQPHIEVVATAVAKANEIQTTPEEQRIKLERLVNTAKTSVACAKATLVPQNLEFPMTEVQLIQQQSRIKQSELKLLEAEKKLAEFDALQASGTTIITDDPVAAAIARAQAKIALSADEKLRMNIDSLQLRLNKAIEKTASAKADNSSAADALQKGVEKLQEKLKEAQEELSVLLANKPEETPLVIAEKNAADQAIEKAKAKAAALANMSDDEKRAEQLQSLKSRLQKAKDRLEKAETENDANIDAFRAGVNKLEEKLAELSAT